MLFFCSVAEAARILGTSLSTTWAAVQAGEIPTVRIRRRVLIPLAHLARLAGLPVEEVRRVLEGGDTGEE